MNPQATNTAEQLCDAFAEFEDASQTLSAFYRELEHQVASLTAELSASRAEQVREFAEKERLAARLENLLEALPGGVVVLDQHGSVQEFNPAATDLLGDLVPGESWNLVVARAFAPRWDDGHDISLKDGRGVNIATQALSGEPGQILLLKDVTETRCLQEQLAHSKRISAKTEMAAAMAHQIRTPLAAALLNTGNLKRRGVADAERDRTVERALKSLRKLERLVDDMLLFARGGKLEVEEITNTDLLTAIESAAADAFDYKEFDIGFEPEAHEGAVFANVAALTSVALNLIENAWHACKGRGRILIRSRASAGALEILFEDNGPGVNPGEYEKIFEPFHSIRKNGTGLGLSIARSVARAHAGELCVNVETTSGACFIMRLPLIASISSPYEPHRPPGGAHAGVPQTIRFQQAG
ncbi:MAG: PAS domain-containing sensor histidine kinase [Gammaproteobacteria bacterium]|nr:PAS domain-containing sensor histidine kinase [Gammaproteobacteria bacterium]